MDTITRSYVCFIRGAFNINNNKDTIRVRDLIIDYKEESLQRYSMKLQLEEEWMLGNWANHCRAQSHVREQLKGRTGKDAAGHHSTERGNVLIKEWKQPQKTSFCTTSEPTELHHTDMKDRLR